MNARTIHVRPAPATTSSGPTNVPVPEDTVKSTVSVSRWTSAQLTLVDPAESAWANLEVTNVPVSTVTVLTGIPASTSTNASKTPTYASQEPAQTPKARMFANVHEASLSEMAAATVRARQLYQISPAVKQTALDRFQSGAHSQ